MKRIESRPLASVNQAGAVESFFPPAAALPFHPRRYALLSLFLFFFFFLNKKMKIQNFNCSLIVLHGRSCSVARDRFLFTNWVGWSSFFYQVRVVAGLGAARHAETTVFAVVYISGIHVYVVSNVLIACSSPVNCLTTGIGIGWKDFIEECCNSVFLVAWIWKVVTTNHFFF